ncbi:MAG TPA: trypsin-like peptidase domain-containing protein [Geminicoccaceae bacterium]|nr:trypsin-like peptidase domain-containing protein [Geminicoccaceae bacterium]
MRVDPPISRTADRPSGDGWLSRAVLVWALALGTFWVGEPYLRGWLYAAREPRAVAARGALADAERNAVEVFEARAPSVALIVTAAAVRDTFGRAGTTAGMGSGFVWDEAGHVVTNNHVVAGAQEIRVRLEADQAVRAEVVGTAPDYDLAVLRPLAPLPPAAQPVPLGSSAGLAVGQTVYAIGNPLGLGRSMSSGIISALDRHLPAASGREIRGVIQTDAAINPGNSGGPLLDSAGRLIGVNTAIVSGSGSSAGVGFAVPVDIVNEVVPELIRRGRAPRPGIGVAALDERAAAALDAPGVVIAEVVPGSAADRAGLRGLDLRARRLGDVITHIDGRRVRTVAELAEALRAAGIGNLARLTVVRDGRELEVSVEVTDIG